MRSVGRTGRAVGIAVLALSAAACGTGGVTGGGGAAGGTDERPAAPPKPVTVETKQHEITWTDVRRKSHRLKAGPAELARGSAADLRKVRLDPDLRKMVPYYLTLSFTNTGGETLERPSPESDFTLAAADGQAGKALSIFSSPLSGKSGIPKDCAKGGPDAVKPGGSAKVCQIVMMPKGAEPAAVSYTGRDARGNQSDPVIWKAGEGGGRGELPAGMLELKETADSAVEDSDGRSVKVNVTPQSVRRGKLSDLARFKLSGDQKNRVPYYASFRFRNDGGNELLPSMSRQAKMRTVSGQTVQRLTLIDIGGDGVAQCPDAKPDGLVKPRASVTECSIFMLPKTDEPVALVFEGEGDGAKPVTWSAK